MNSLRKRAVAALVLVSLACLSGCKPQVTGEIQVPQVEEVIFMLEGVPESQSYTRIQGRDNFSIAYNPEQFKVVTTQEELRFESISYGMESETPVFVSIREVLGESVEEVADRFVMESNEECTVEELTVGEGEYPAVWVGFSEGTDAASRTCDMYILRYNEKIYVIQMDCFLEAYGGLGASQALILSTLRFDEG